MAVQKENLAERVQRSYKLLSAVATDLNTASDRLGASVATLETLLRKLNLGVSTWVHFTKSHSENSEYYYFEDIGYTKLSGKWGLAIRTVSGAEFADQDEVDAWAFNEAPRGLRVKSIVKVPDLLDQLIKEATGMIKDINEGAAVVDLLASAMNSGPPDSVFHRKLEAALKNQGDQPVTNVTMAPESGKTNAAVNIIAPRPGRNNP
ncbi:MAG: hypothetical protein ABSH32_24855 [Bryobacteraceae bacterium]